MGYDIHITRKDSWFDEDESNEIKMSEWISYVKNDLELRLDDLSEASTESGDQLRYENNGLVVWTAYSRNGVERENWPINQGR